MIKRKNKAFSVNTQNKLQPYASGFTLAEVLMTLTILGVTAAMAIPAVLMNIEESGLIAKWKKVYSSISQATTYLQINGESIDLTSHDTFSLSYKDKFKYVKEDITKNIFAPYYKFYKNYNDQGAYFGGISNPAAVLPDGTFIGFRSYNESCKKEAGDLKNICGYIFVDLNGTKGPNMMGKDSQRLWVVKKNGTYITYPFGGNGDGTSCVANSITYTTSSGCASLALYADKMP